MTPNSCDFIRADKNTEKVVKAHTKSKDSIVANTAKMILDNLKKKK